MKGRTPSPETLARMEPYTGPAIEWPEWLDDIARQEWARVAPEIAGCLTPVDAQLLATYCHAFSVARHCALTLREQGYTSTGSRGNEVQHPLARIMFEAFAQMRRIAADFGFSPASRARLKAPSAPSQDDIDFEAGL